MTKTLPVITKPTFVAPSQKKEEQSLASLVRENKLATTVAVGAIAAVSYGVHSYLSPEPLPITPVDGDSFLSAIVKTGGIALVAYLAVSCCCIVNEIKTLPKNKNIKFY